MGHSNFLVSSSHQQYLLSGEEEWSVAQSKFEKAFTDMGYLGEFQVERNETSD